MHHFTTDDLLQKHNKDFPNCVNEPSRIIYPKKEEAFIQFQKIYNKFRAPFIIYADFESCLEEFNDDNSTSCTKKLQLQTANSCCYKIISTFDGFYLEYSLVDQTLIFYTTNDNDFLGSYILDESIFPDNKNNNPNNIIIPHTCPGSYTPFDAFCQQCQLIHNSYSSQPCNACVSNGQTG